MRKAIAILVSFCFLLTSCAVVKAPIDAASDTVGVVTTGVGVVCDAV